MSPSLRFVGYRGSGKTSFIVSAVTYINKQKGYHVKFPEKGLLGSIKALREFNNERLKFLKGGENAQAELSTKSEKYFNIEIRKGFLSKDTTRILFYDIPGGETEEMELIFKDYISNPDTITIGIINAEKYERPFNANDKENRTNNVVIDLIKNAEAGVIILSHVDRVSYGRVGEIIEDIRKLGCTADKVPIYRVDNRVAEESPINPGIVLMQILDI